MHSVGIVDLVTYFPRNCGSLDALEVTVGLGQRRMSFVTDREDVTSLALTVLDRLVRKAGIGYGAIGRLEVGTETLLDRSKSVKSSLMQLFASCGNLEVEGLDNTNGCYGGTQAIFNSLNWIDSPDWCGKYAVVVCSDIAVYKPGSPARATGGAGSVAILLGRGDQVCIEIERGLKSTLMQHTYDFFKPDGNTEYPTVHGADTMECYIRGLESTYAKWKERCAASVPSTTNISSVSNGVSSSGESDNTKECSPVPVSLDNGVDYVLFHTPFNKMIRKALGRMHWHDIKYSGATARDKSLYDYCGVGDDPHFSNRQVTKTFEKFTRDMYEDMVAPGAWLAVETGNIYTGSLYANLYALMAAGNNNSNSNMEGKRILAYSYGSGMAASTFSMRVVSTRNFGTSSTREEIMAKMDERVPVDSGVFEKWMRIGQVNWNRFGYVPTGSIDEMDDLTFYLKEVLSDGRRVHGRKMDDK